MKKRLVGVAVLFLLIGLALALWPRPDDTDIAPVRLPPERRVIALGVPAAPPADEPVEADPPATPVDEAYAALAQGHGGARITCALPAGAAPYFYGVERPTNVANVLRAVVTQPSGSMAVYPRIEIPRCASDDPECQTLKREQMRRRGIPMGRVHWQDAYTGDSVGCEFEERRSVRLSGSIQLPDGSSLTSDEGSRAWGCGDGGLGPDGRFAIEGWAGIPCQLQAQSASDEGQLSGSIMVTAEHDRSDLVIALAQPVTIQHDSLEDALAGEVADVEHELERPSALQVALANPDLSAEARAILQGWSDEEEARHRARRQQLLDAPEQMRQAGERARREREEAPW